MKEDKGMKPLRKYNKATIWFRDHTQPDGEYFEVNVYSSMVIYFDEKGKEHTIPMVFVKEIIEYAEDRTPKETIIQPTPTDPNVTVTVPNQPKPVQEYRKIQSPKKGMAYHV